ncbi:DUF2079 domain-containing protein [Palaeococcus sp. (in: euryarchaeotes)]
MGGNIKKLSHYELTIIVIFLAYFIVLSLLCLRRYGTFEYRSLDLGIFTQSLSSTLKGCFFYNTVEYQWYGVSSHFGVHNQPLLLLILPLYALFPSPKTLLILQAFALASSIPIAFELAREELGERGAFVLTLLYATNSSLLGIGFFEFHPVSLAVPLLLLSALLWRRGRKGAFLFTSMLVLAAKEDAPLGVLSLALYELLNDMPKSKLAGKKWLLGVMGLSLLWLVLSLKLIIPHFRTAGYIYTRLYDGFELDSRKILYFIVVNLTFGLFPLMRLRNLPLLALPWAESLLAVRETQTMIGFHYPYMIVPLSFIASVDTLRDRKLKDVLAPLLILSIITSLATYPLTSSPLLQDRYIVHAHLIEKPDDRDVLIWSILKALKKSNCSIYTQPRFYSSLANKLDVYLGVTNVDVLFFDMRTYEGRKFKKRFGKGIANYTLAYSKDGLELYVKRDKMGKCGVKSLPLR